MDNSNILEEGKNDNYRNIVSWEDKELNLKEKLLRGIYSYGFEKPSSIQKRAIYPLIYGIVFIIVLICTLFYYFILWIARISSGTPLIMLKKERII